MTQYVLVAESMLLYQQKIFFFNINLHHLCFKRWGLHFLCENWSLHFLNKKWCHLILDKDILSAHWGFRICMLRGFSALLLLVWVYDIGEVVFYFKHAKNHITIINGWYIITQEGICSFLLNIALVILAERRTVSFWLLARSFSCRAASYTLDTLIMVWKVAKEVDAI